MKDLGYYAGDIDGRSGPATQAAILAFRKNNGLGAGTALDAAGRAVLDGGTAVGKGDRGTAMADQQALKDLGYYKSKVDGRTGPVTKAAIAEFRAANGLPPGTTLDAAARELMRTGKAVAKAKAEPAAAPQPSKASAEEGTDAPKATEGSANDAQATGAEKAPQK